MGRKPKAKPSFFKVLIKDFAQKLNLPPVFVQKYGRMLPGTAELRTSFGETWSVKLEIEDEKYCFTGGWSKFVKDAELEVGEFLVFWFNIGKSTFDVSVYGINGCEKEISSRNNTLTEDSDAELRNDDANKKQPRTGVCQTEAGGSGITTNPRFEVVLTQSRKLRPSLRKGFAEAACLIGKKAVVLEYPPKDRYWPVLLDSKSLRHFRLDFAAGWLEFRRENDLRLGKTYSFEFNPTKNVIQVRELK
ncbi:B3 domain-containing protein At1g49475-like [Sesamum indicum]|uniref:B3 domain-containing protein At1g49475-like n=1 Tax=Sesamum indicum TaxID=4182 RepID=A0A6I9UVW8_SESIN|nr:B3 domain-containing protein At1g49475-like [Sesamum indicum]